MRYCVLQAEINWISNINKYICNLHGKFILATESHCTDSVPIDRFIFLRFDWYQEFFRFSFVFLFSNFIMVIYFFIGRILIEKRKPNSTLNFNLIWQGIRIEKRNIDLYKYKQNVKMRYLNTRKLNEKQEKETKGNTLI